VAPGVPGIGETVDDEGNIEDVKTGEDTVDVEDRFDDQDTPDRFDDDDDDDDSGGGDIGVPDDRTLSGGDGE